MTEGRSLYLGAHLTYMKRMTVCVTIIVRPAMLLPSQFVVVVVDQNTCDNWQAFAVWYLLRCTPVALTETLFQGHTDVKHLTRKVVFLDQFDHVLENDFKCCTIVKRTVWNTLIFPLFFFFFFLSDFTSNSFPETIWRFHARQKCGKLQLLFRQGFSNCAWLVYTELCLFIPDWWSCLCCKVTVRLHVDVFALSELVWPSVRLVSRGTSVRIRFGSSFFSKVVVCGHCLVTLSHTIIKH